MTSKIISSALTVIGAYAVIKYAYMKGEEKGKASLWKYFETASPKDFERIMNELKENRSNE